jgi:glucose uptake protein GlcU
VRNKIVIGSEVVGIANTRNAFCLVIASPRGVAISFLLSDCSIAEPIPAPVLRLRRSLTSQ